MSPCDTLDAMLGRLRSADLEAGWSGVLAAELEIAHEVRDRALRWIRAERDAFLDCLRAIDDPVDRRMVLAVRYIELKCAWTQINTHNNYVAVRGGHPDGEQVLRAGLLSQLLGNLETLLTPDEILDITDFLSRPIHEFA